jgi:hypothetical protein
MLFTAEAQLLLQRADAVYAVFQCRGRGHRSRCMLACTHKMGEAAGLLRWQAYSHTLMAASEQTGLKTGTAAACKCHLPPGIGMKAAICAAPPLTMAACPPPVLPPALGLHCSCMGLQVINRVVFASP